MSANDLKLFRQNGKMVASIREQLVQYAATHHAKEAVEALAQKLIRQAGGEPAFAKVPGYKWATCISVNDEIVHSIPKGKFENGDLVTIDLGMYWRGTTTDTATSFVIGTATPEQEQFLKVGKKALDKAIKRAVAGARVREIAETIQKTIEGAGFSVVRTLTGHGLGKTMHEPPAIPCFISSDPTLLTRLKLGMVLAIEVMFTAGDWRLVVAKDGWTQKSADGSLTAVFEQDVIVGNKFSEVIT